MVYKLLYTHLLGMSNGGGSSAIAKFMLSVHEESFKTIAAEASDRGISVQELLRAVVVPDWVRHNIDPSAQRRSLREVAARWKRRSRSAPEIDQFVTVAPVLCRPEHVPVPHLGA